MRRASLERARTLGVWRAHIALVHDGLPASCTCDEQPGRFRKSQRIAGCPKPRCWLCNRHKLTNELTARDYRAALSHREQVAEFGFTVAKPRRP